SEPSRVTRSGRAGQYVRVPTAPGHSLTQRDGTRSDTIEPEGSTSATCTAKKNSHPPSSRPTSATAVPHFSSQPPSPCSTAREQPLEPPAVSPVKQRFRFAQKKTPAKAFSLLAEATHTSTDRHCSTVVNELPPSVPPVSDHLKKLSSPSVSLTTAGFVLVDPPDEPLDVFSPMDVNAEVMPTRSLPRVIPVLPSPSILPSQRPQTRRSKRLRSSAAPEVNPPAPAPKLRLRHTSEDVKLKAACSKLLNTLDKPSPAKVSTLMSQLRRSTKSDYSICGTVFPATLFFDLLKPQQWVSSMHMDLLIAFVWDTYNPFFITRRITILDSMFTSIISNKYMSFKQDNNNKAFVWHPLLISYVKGQVSPRRPEIQWMRDVDTVYLPMNWGTRHWVGLAIDLKKGHIDILDPFEDLTSARKVVSFMSPFAQMLPQLILSNKRGGDCGPLSVKFMEFTMFGLQSSLLNITPAQIDNARLRYALDIYETYVKKL
ncbi:Papain-like cysteine peptidase superfamily, partial [Arabidopsis suecica]